MAFTLGIDDSTNPFVLLPGHERWHSNPAFHYQTGGGPIFDMGPYYLRTLVNLLDPIERVVSCGRKAFSQRTIGSGPRQGQSFPEPAAIQSPGGRARPLKPISLLGELT